MIVTLDDTLYDYPAAHEQQSPKGICFFLIIIPFKESLFNEHSCSHVEGGKDKIQTYLSLLIGMQGLIGTVAVSH